MDIFEGYYSESKNIEKASTEGSSYTPKHCSVKLNHQPIDRVKAGAAYIACTNLLAASVADFKLVLGGYDLELMKINNRERKIQMVEIMVTTLDLISQFVCVDLDLPHDHYHLAASYLTKHHEELLQFISTKLGYFVERYRKINDCGRPLEKHGELYSRLFETAESNNTSKPPADPNKVPITSTTITKQSNQADKDQTPSAVSTPSIQGVSKALFQSAAPPSNQNKAPNPNDSVAGSSITTNETLTTASSKPPAAANQNDANNIPPAAAKKGLTRLVVDGRVFYAEDALDEAISKQAPNAFPGFTRASELLGDEISDAEFLRAGQEADIQIARDRKEVALREKCKIWALTDSIRKESAHHTPQTSEDDLELSHQPSPRTQAALIGSLATTPTSVEAMNIIHRCMMQLFVKAPATFISQWQFNSKANLISRIAKGKSIEKKAAETPKSILKVPPTPTLK
eukprot:scaffold38675_cov33-Cyclotella_meneghiniana.AAC.2